MYPNPQDVLPIPPRPSVEQYRKRARDLVRAHAAEGAVGEWSRRWVEALWRAQRDDTPRAPDAAEQKRAAQQVAAFANDRLSGSRGTLSQAQFVIARAHGFPSWTQLLRHLEAITHQQSEHARFEQAADAVVRGDLALLQRLIAHDPTLVTTRSDRAHRATLLHYVSANGIENYRQRTPHNIVAVATLLLDAGADVRATCDVYGGDADTLGLVITSAHPRAAGVQLALADLLVARGAHIGTGSVRSALANGCPEAAAHLAPLCLARSIPLDLQELAGIGRADLVDAALRNWQGAPPDCGEALSMAAWYGERETVRVLLRHGAPVGTANGDGATPLHVASYAGQADLVDELLAVGADVHCTDAQYNSTPLAWALHAWLVDHRSPAEPYHRIVAALLDAGAHVPSDWVDDDRVRLLRTRPEA